MGQAIINHDRHNASVVTKALKQQNGIAMVTRLPVYCSDDETLLRALRMAPGVTFKGFPGRRAIVELKEGERDVEQRRHHGTR